MIIIKEKILIKNYKKKIKENNSRNIDDLKIVSKKKISKFSSTTFMNSEAMEKNQKADNNIILLKNKIMDDFELNNLEFEEALELDSRNYKNILVNIKKRIFCNIYFFQS